MAGNRRTHRFRPLVATGVVLVVIAGTASWITRSDDAPFVERCTASVDGHSTSMSPEEAANAATVVGISVRRGLPARAATIAIATIVQESGMRNLDYGDRDSLGLFQQRPSQGWGTAEEVRDPVFATNAFYDALVEIEGYRDLPVTQAAQRVQRSGFPLAYADHEPEARLIASALTGFTPRGFSCRLRDAQRPTQSGDDDDLTPAAGALRGALGAQVVTEDPRIIGGTAGRGLEYTLSGPDAPRLAWATAGWAVASAASYDVVEISVEGSRWTRSNSGRGWITTATGVPSGSVQIRVG